MKTLKELIKHTAVKSITGDESRMVTALTYDSRTVGAQNAFFAVRGTQADGHRFIGQAIAGGADTIVCEELPAELSAEVTYVLVADSQGAMADMAAAFYDFPSRELNLVGITGTNGKTTTVTLLYDLVRALGYKAGLISTVIYKIEEREIPATHTTPDSIRLNSLMREMVDAGCSFCFMECSSHAIVQERTRGLNFVGGLFSNITHDHLDYHKTFAEYIRAKKLFFDHLPKEAFAVVNIDDRNGRVMVQNTAARIRTTSLQEMADYRCKIMEMHLDGMLLRMDGEELWVKLIGRFNAENLLAVYAAAVELGFEKGEVLRVLSTLGAVRGRFEVVRSKTGKTAVIDYAHTPDALEHVIETIEELRQPDQKLFVVCGCGGNRDKTKRPEMAAIAVKYASMSVFTSDNPRKEDPNAILQDMLAGVKPTDHYITIADRREAIRTAVMLSSDKDVILIAGKGHEDYQIIGDEKHHFDDREEVMRCFEQ